MLTVGIDEVGRGCWAGPVVAGAVVLGKPIAGLADSKQLSRKARQSLDAIIKRETRAIGLGWVSSQEVDSLGLTEAVRLAMRRALDEIDAVYDEIVIDGNYNFLADQPAARAIVKADQTEPAVSAASIVAKVARDNYMASLPQRYAMYEFGRHVGYGTALHVEKLQQFGVSPLHRISFAPVKALLHE